MKIDLDRVLEATRPGPLVITIDGNSYKVRTLLIADGDKLDSFEKLGSDEQCREFMESLFDGDAPRCVRSIGDPSLDEDGRAANNLAVLIVRQAITTAYIERFSIGAALTRAHELIEEQAKAQRPPAN